MEGPTARAGTGSRRREDRTPHRAAFSLVEIVLVVAIVAVIGAIAMPRYALAVSRYRADAAVRRVVADLKLARRSAMSASASRSVVFDLNNHGYTMAGVQALDSASGTYAVELRTSPYRCRIVSAVLGDDAVVIFDGYGMPDSGGSILLESGDTQRTVVVDGNTGEATVQ